MVGNPGSGYEVTYVDDYWQENRRVVLIVEDHQIVRDGMRKVVGDVLAGVGVEALEAATLAEARRIIGERSGELDLVLLDINLPDAGGADEVECLKAEWTALPVVVVSACEDWGLAADFLRAGALGFIPKSSNVSVMVNALRLIFAGGRYFPPQVFDLLTEGYAGDSSPAQDHEVPLKNQNPVHTADLSPRQREVLTLMLQGRSNKEIARELGVSVGTAKNYVAVVLRAYNASSRAKAMMAALNSGASGNAAESAKAR
jgi:DNA-binding NarL/FixJ family response regulator